MYTYLYFNILVIIFPFLLSFDKRVAFWRKWPYLFISIIFGDLIFVTWDSIVTDIGHWSFNEDHLTGIWVFGIPLEELLFFVTVPYACLFTYEVIQYYLREWRVPFNRYVNLALAAVLVIAAFLFMDQGYTFIVLLYTAGMVVIATFAEGPLLKSRKFWIYTLITIGLFTVFNMILTAIPIVEYSPEHIWGGDGLFNGRFFTIPLEDFFYNFSLLTTYLLFYLFAKRIIKRRAAPNEE
jgi:lycopene cyclase domain-containing protein